ncbi:hypothetical protein BDY19DRAFT_889730 [Irpex rosettiformis]|uniref:Uncharacterized protein n=1 Tax=Irpex rosettiformis TaxID=378272 RepID=A0ACB8U4P0_9APHY|nr:hypothetical protein BDY19DRAFT_889730 [Irpex rosettiformis]
MLLQWCTLEPSGPSQLAALRFSSPVRIKSISIFPMDYQPFEKCPDIVSRTEPEAFFLELYFNAHPVSNPNSKEKPKPSNALVPTVLAYAGGRMDFFVNMGVETATRLVVVKGSFERVSMAIYGVVSSEMSPPPSSYEAKLIPSVEPIPLYPPLDPGSHHDPTTLAYQLLELIPDAPPLPLIIRLMFCLKPSNDDWDTPGFPYLYADLDGYPEDSGIEQAMEVTRRPVADDALDVVLQSFSHKVAQALASKDENTAYFLSKLLSHIACQHPELSRSLLGTIELEGVFDAHSLDEDTLERLFDSMANADIAKAFNKSWFLELLASISRSSSNNRELQLLAQQLLTRLEGMPIIEDVLLNTQGAFSTAALTIKNLTSQERSFGTWLASMITHRDLLDKLNENPPLSVPSQYPLPLLKNNRIPISHEEFITFLRAVLGVSSVLAVYAWADSLPHQNCRERALGILRLWQDVDGYREIVNHLLLSRQMIFRLECMLDNEIPTRAGIDAEHILVNLAKDPHAILHPELMKSILSLKPPHCYITQEERLSMQEAAEIAEDGLRGAVDYLVQPPEQPLNSRSVRSLRVALAIISKTLQSEGEQEVLREFWDTGSNSLETCLANLYVELNEEICKHFSVNPSTSLSSQLLPEVFQASDQTISILLRLVPHYPLPGRTIRYVVSSAADLFASTDLIDLVYAQTSPACIAAQHSRQSCIDIVRSLATAQGDAPDGSSYAETILRTLLIHGLQFEDKDPVHHLLQVFSFIDYLLPLPGDIQSSSEQWTLKVLPNLLRELWTFCSALDTENKAHFVRRLVGLDHDIIGIGDWLLQQELQSMLTNLTSLEETNNLQCRLALQYQLALSVQFLLDLMSSSSSVSEWCKNALIADPDVANILALCLEKLSELNVISAPLTTIVQTFASDPSRLLDEIKLPIALTVLRICQFEEVNSKRITSALHQALSILHTLPSYLVNAQNVAYEVSALLYLLSTSSQLIDGDLPDALLKLLEWLEGVDDPAATIIQGITSATFMSLSEKFKPQLSNERQSILAVLQTRFKFPAQEGVARSAIILPDNMKLSIQDLEYLLREPTPAPSTPKRILNQDALSTVTISPPTAVIRSPAATGLTKTYFNNDFRQLRQAPSARQNTSRLPSMHVDVGSMV